MTTSLEVRKDAKRGRFIVPVRIQINHVTSEEIVSVGQVGADEITIYRGEQ